MKKLICFILSAVFLVAFNIQALAVGSNPKNTEATSLDGLSFEVNAKSAVLMEANTGKILFKQNEDVKSSPASVTKIMTLLLVAEAISEGKIEKDDAVVISEHAASMGGSQVFLEEGERMTVEELVKCAVIASANDAAVALAEHVGGSEKIFVSMMNKRAEELGMENTSFENATGLDDSTQNHVTSAEDIAIMSRELIKYELIKKYSSLWQDTIRNGEFTLTNTNRLVRYYDGCNGLKTGSTDKAGYCISATAERGGMQLIAVIMGAETRDIRNAQAKAMLDFGFSNYALYSQEEKALEMLDVLYGTKESIRLYSSPFCTVVPKGSIKSVELFYEIPESVTAPINANDVVGRVTYKIGDEVLGTSDIYVCEEIGKITFFEVFARILKTLIIGNSE